MVWGVRDVCTAYAREIAGHEDSASSTPVDVANAAWAEANFSVDLHRDDARLRSVEFPAAAGITPREEQAEHSGKGRASDAPDPTPVNYSDGVPVDHGWHVAMNVLGGAAGGLIAGVGNGIGSCALSGWFGGTPAYVGCVAALGGLGTLAGATAGAMHDTRYDKTIGDFTDRAVRNGAMIAGNSLMRGAMVIPMTTALGLIGFPLIGKFNSVGIAAGLGTIKLGIAGAVCGVAIGMTVGSVIGEISSLKEVYERPQGPAP